MLETSSASSRRTDLPTALIHWGLVAALLISLLTGWRIASMGSPPGLVKALAPYIWQGDVLRWHVLSAAALVGITLAYAIFIWRLRLGARLQFRARALTSDDPEVKWRAVNRMIYGLAFLILGIAACSGALLYFFPGSLPGRSISVLHLWASIGLVVYVFVHVLAQLMLGGVGQLLRIVLPRPGYGAVGAMALLIGGVAAVAAYLSDRGLFPSLKIVATQTLPTLDGDGADAEWSLAPEQIVLTSRGFNAQGGDVPVHVRALHDEKNAYFLFRWPDATFSQKHIPLRKTAQGWEVIQKQYFTNDENDYYEDKFSAMLSRSPLPAGNAMQVGPRPLAERPGPDNGLGLHVTSDGSYVDVWHWKSVRSGSIHQFDDNYFGPPMDAKPGRYTGGYTQDPKTAGGFEQNFEKIAGSSLVRPKFLPRDLAAQLRRQGPFDPDPDVGDKGVFAMARAEVEPYSERLDAAIPVGTVMPSVVYDRPFEGDRGDVAAFAQWKDGWWTLEARRALNTGSKFDQPIESGMFMWVAAFDHNQVRHTRHLRPLRINLQ